MTTVASGHGEAVRLTDRFGLCAGVACCRAVAALSVPPPPGAYRVALCALVEIERARAHLHWFSRVFEQAGHLVAGGRSRSAASRLGESLLAARGGEGLPGMVVPGEVRVEDLAAAREAVAAARGLLPRLRRATRGGTGKILARLGTVLRDAHPRSGPPARAAGGTEDVRRREAAHRRRGFAPAVSTSADVRGLTEVMERELDYALAFAGEWLAGDALPPASHPRYLRAGVGEGCVETPAGGALCRATVEHGRLAAARYEPPPPAFAEVPDELRGFLP